MPDNPYAPPRADVRDLTPDRAIAERPKQVAWAIALLCLSLLLDLPGGFITGQETIDHAGVQALVLAISLAVNGLLIFFVARGHNWARIVLLLLVVLGVLSIFFTLEMHLDDPAAVQALMATSTVIDMLALYWLFSHPGRLWFRRA